MNLLQAVHDHAEHVNAFEGLSFNLGNIITLVGLIFGGVRLWMKIVSNQQDSDNRIKGLEDARTKAEENYTSEIKAASHGRIAIKKELYAKIKEEHEHARARIDKTQLDLKEHKQASDGEFKELNKSLGSIDGKLDILILQLKK